MYAIAFTLFNLLVTRLKYLKEVFQGKKCFIIDTGRLLNFAKVHIVTKAAAPCVYNLCIIWHSDDEEDSPSSLFGCVILIHNEGWRYTNNVKLSRINVGTSVFFWCKADRTLKFLHVRIVYLIELLEVEQ